MLRDAKHIGSKKNVEYYALIGWRMQYRHFGLSLQTRGGIENQ
jgi:hypothetical protein